jgi:hypothetical protein
LENYPRTNPMRGLELNRHLIWSKAETGAKLVG